MFYLSNDLRYDMEEYENNERVRSPVDEVTDEPIQHEEIQEPWENQDEVLDGVLAIDNRQPSQTQHEEV